MWSALIDELDRWRESGAMATFWWRDDDAVSATDELDALLACAGDVPIALAVVPDLADQSLAVTVAAHPSVTVLQHGWRHANHASEGANSEYPPGRALHEVAAEFLAGRQILGRLFGAQSATVFAPPWHGFDPMYLPFLSPAGLTAISRKGPRNAPVACRLVVSNIHCVPIAWTAPPSFGEDANYLSAIVDHLEGRRMGRYDTAEATGVLTHHLVQNARSYEFMGRLARTVTEHPAARWSDAREIFQL